MILESKSGRSLEWLGLSPLYSSVNSNIKTQNKMDNFHKLIEGFHNFKQTYFLKERQYFESLEKAQNPKTLVVACCDSRVDPAILLHCKPGDLFVIRNVAALVPAVTQASNPCSVMSAIEYGVKHLNVEHIVVMGHSHCGGIHGLMAPETIAGETYIQDWVGIASPALERLQAITGDEDEKTRSRHCEEGAVLISLDNLLSYPWIAERVKNGQLKLHALYYDLSEGNLYRFSPDSEDFELLFHTIENP